MPNLDFINTLNPSSIGSAVEVTVSNIASPTELNSRAAAQGDVILARTTEAGTGNQTWYYADNTSDAESLPYIVSSATAGVKFIAFAGRYQNQNANTAALTASRLLRTDANKNLESNAALTSTRVLYADGSGWPTDSANFTWSGTTLQTIGSGGVSTLQASTQDAMRLLGRAGGTGSFIGTLTPTTLSASRTYTFPDAAIVVAGSASALTSGRIPFVTTGGLLTDSANLTFGSSSTFVGLVRTPNTWGGNYSGIECRASSLAEYYSAGNIQINCLGNAYDSGAGAFKYVDTDSTTAFRCFPSSRLFTWSSAASGTSGSAITFTEHMRLDSAQLLVSHTASNAIQCAGGVVSTNATAGIGYRTGAGTAVTQLTSRTTGVTINNVCGAITLFSAAGSAAYQTFTVTNSAVAATDTIIVNQKSGTDLNIILVTNVAAGSFKISFATTGGTTVEQPVFNFAVIKAVAA